MPPPLQYFILQIPATSAELQSWSSPLTETAMVCLGSIFLQVLDSKFKQKVRVT